MDSPIIFSAPMVRALLEGRKTQTRRVAKYPVRWEEKRGRHRYEPGDRLWVRETFVDGLEISYRASEPAIDGIKWTSPIHMPRWASRITLEVIGVRIERLQEISAEDEIAEGCNGGTMLDLWDSIHGPGAWDENPWVYAITFKANKGNIDD